MSTVLPGTPESPREDGHRLSPYRDVVCPSGGQRRWVVIVLVMSGCGRSSGCREERAPTRTARKLRAPRRAEGRHRRQPPQTVLDVISEMLGDERRFVWIVVMLAMIFIGLRRRARRRVLQSVLTAYLR